MATEEKKGPSDGSDYYQEGDEQDESSERDEKSNKEMKELEKKRKWTEDRKKKQKEDLEKKDKDRKNLRKKKIVKIGGEKVSEAKIFEHKRGKGIFIRGESKKYLTKMDEAFKKLHGVSSEKKKRITEFMGLSAKMKSKITEKEVDTILRGLKHKKFNKPPFENVFKKMKKEGVDLEIYKKELKGMFSKRDVGKFKRVLKGEEDSHKHEIKRTSNRNPEAGKPGSTSHHRL